MIAVWVSFDQVNERILVEAPVNNAEWLAGFLHCATVSLEVLFAPTIYCVEQANAGIRFVTIARVCMIFNVVTT
jgi:hypothetical protein